MANETCKYCALSPELYRIAVPAFEFPSSRLFLMRNQAYRGRCVVAFKEHRAELFELSAAELAAFMGEAARAAAAIKAAFGADKINYAVYGDLAPHLHFHLVPKYRGGLSWGGPFELDPSPAVLLPEEEYEGIAEEIRKRL